MTPFARLGVAPGVAAGLALQSDVLKHHGTAEMNSRS